MSWLPDLADLYRYIGVAITVSGALITAPGAIGRIWRGLVSGTVGKAQAIVWWVLRGPVIRALAQVLIWLRFYSPEPSSTDTAVPKRRASAWGTLNATVTGPERTWPETGSVDDKFDALRKQLTEVEGRVGKLNQGLRDEQDARKAADEELARRLTAEVATIKERIAATEAANQGINALGLPVVVFGVILTGLPEFARVPVFGWLLLAFCVLYTVIAAFLSRRRAEPPSAVQAAPDKSREVSRV